MAWTAPKTWAPGEFGISSVEINTHVADNLQHLFDEFTNIRGIYKNHESVDLQSSWAEIDSLTLTTRHEALLLSLIGTFPPHSQVRYSIATNPTLIILTIGASARTVAKSWIIPSLTTGEHTVQIDAQGSGQILSLQIDLRELT